MMLNPVHARAETFLGFVLFAFEARSEGLTEIACVFHCKSYRLLCNAYWQIYLFFDHRFICSIVAREHHPSNPAYTI